MATSTSLTSELVSRQISDSQRLPAWLWPNVLSLDAPIVAALWQSMFALDAGGRISLSARLALPLAVWMIYLSDRLLDTSKGGRAQVTARHGFYLTYRPFCYALTSVVLCALLISVCLLPASLLWNGSAVAAAVAAYMAVVHWSEGRWHQWFPKEAAVACVFAVGTVLAPATEGAHPVRLIGPAILFAVLCWMNCAAIEVWESGHTDSVSAWIAEHMSHISALCGAFAFGFGLMLPVQHAAWALMLSSAGFWAMAPEYRQRLSPRELRVWADVPFLSPLFFFGLR